MYIELSKEEIREILEKQIKEKTGLEYINLFFDIVYYDGTYDTDASYEITARYVIMNSISIFGKTYESQNIISLERKEIFDYLQEAFATEGYKYDFLYYDKPYNSNNVIGIRFYLKKKEEVITRKLEK